MTNKQKTDYLNKLLDKWQAKLLMSHWNVELFVSEKPDDEDENLRAESKSDLTYYEASIVFYPAYWKHSEKERESTFVHELLHSVLNPLKELTLKAKNGHAVFNDEIRQASEQTTSHLERIIMRLWQEWKPANANV